MKQPLCFEVNRFGRRKNKIINKKKIESIGRVLLKEKFWNLEDLLQILELKSETIVAKNKQ
jgi:uncharacterized protein (UPF0216 family)